MEPVIGHRRRKSSLMTPAGQNPLRIQGNNSQSSNIAQEFQIPEEQPQDEERRGRDSLSDEDLHDDEETGLTVKDKRRKQKKRRQNTQLDQRIAKGNDQESDTKNTESVTRRLFINAILIGLWYIFSLSISLVSFP